MGSPSDPVTTKGWYPEVVINAQEVQIYGNYNTPTPKRTDILGPIGDDIVYASSNGGHT